MRWHGASPRFSHGLPVGKNAHAIRTLPAWGVNDMGTRKMCSPRRVKTHRSYTIAQISESFGFHPNTVHRWIRSGSLKICRDSLRPILVLGEDLADFFERRRSATRQPCGEGLFFCMRCRAPRHPIDPAVRHFGVGQLVARIQARCGQCGALMNRFVSSRLLGDASSPTPLRSGRPHIEETPEPVLNGVVRGAN